MKLFLAPSLGRKAAAGILVAVLALGTAVGTFASQDMLPGQSQDSPSVQVVDDDAADNDTGQRAIVGIPEDNPVHQPAATPEACEKGETAVKTTPSGKQVNVPCHAVEPDADDDDGETNEGEAVEEDADDDTGQRAIVGIPEDNPNHQPADGDDVCDKGETDIKITPSENQVNVPCHALDPGPPSFSHGHHGDNGHGNNGDDSDKSDKDDGGNG
jgi:hypothetical protein